MNPGKTTLRGSAAGNNICRFATNRNFRERLLRNPSGHPTSPPLVFFRNSFKAGYDPLLITKHPG